MCDDDMFKQPHPGKSIAIKGIISSNTKAVIYVVTCACGKSSVGKTSRELSTNTNDRLHKTKLKNHHRNWFWLLVCIYLYPNTSSTCFDTVFQFSINTVKTLHDVGLLDYII